MIKKYKKLITATKHANFMQQNLKFITKTVQKKSSRVNSHKRTKWNITFIFISNRIRSSDYKFTNIDLVSQTGL